MTVYYNEYDKYCAQWLRNLIAAGHIADGDVDERSIEDVRPDDLRGYTQCHFFAGIGVWSYALRLAGWPEDRPVWTGSCPCQPFSKAGEGAGFADERHLWPAWLHLIGERRPSEILGEQVAGEDGLAWLDLVQSDLEGVDYACGPVVLPAAGVGADHRRERQFFAAYSLRERRKRHLALKRVPLATGAPFPEPCDASARIRAALAGDYADLLPGYEPTVAVERLRAHAYGNAIYAQAAAEFIRAAA